MSYLYTESILFLSNLVLRQLTMDLTEETHIIIKMYKIYVIWQVYKCNNLTPRAIA